MILTIAVPTITGREKQFRKLMTNLYRQQIPYLKEVELIHLTDNRVMSIGEKRDKLYNMAKGDYTIMVDDDDTLHDEYIKLVLPALKKGPDCVGYKEFINFGGESRASMISLKFKEWENCRPVRHGIWYYRTPFCKTPIKTDICREVGVKDMRFAEDHDFAKRVYPHLKTEEYIDEFLYFYNTKPMTQKELKDRYGV